MRYRAVATEFHVAQQRDRLQGFTQTLEKPKTFVCCLDLADDRPYHFIRQNTIDTIIMQRDHPVQATNLIITHLSTFDN